MQFIMISRRRAEQFTPEQFAPHLAAEQEHAREMYQSGILRQIWHRADPDGGAVQLLEAGCIEDVTAAVSDLPLAKLGMLEIVSIIPLQPYAGFFPRGDHS